MPGPLTGGGRAQSCRCPTCMVQGAGCRCRVHVKAGAPPGRQHEPPRPGAPDAALRQGGSSVSTARGKRLHSAHARFRCYARHERERARGWSTAAGMCAEARLDWREARGQWGPRGAPSQNLRHALLHLLGKGKSPCWVPARVAPRGTERVGALLLRACVPAPRIGTGFGRKFALSLASTPRGH